MSGIVNAWGCCRVGTNYSAGLERRYRFFTLPFEREAVLSESLFANPPRRVAMVTASCPTDRIQLRKDTLDVRFHSAFVEKKRHSP